MRQLNDSSTPVLKPSTVKQLLVTTGLNDEEEGMFVA